MFPFAYKATAIGFVNFVARSVTTMSSIGAEMDRPWPISMLLIAHGVAFISVFFLPWIDEEEEIERKVKEASEGADGENREDFSGGSEISKWLIEFGDVEEEEREV